MIKQNSAPMALSSTEAGFTLLEVMIALAILALMSLAIFYSTDQLLRSKEDTEIRDEKEHAISLALNRIADDLSMAYTVKNAELLGQDFDGEIAFKGSEERINFAAFANQPYLRNVRESDSAEIGYYLEPMPEDPKKYNLMRRQSAEVDRDVEVGGRFYVLMEDVEKLTFQYWDDKSEEWKKNWDSTSIDFANKLPRAVKVEIEVMMPDEEEKKTFSVVAPIRLHQGALLF